MLTTRKRLACLTCNRRKVKCDKQLPCGNCVKRGVANECQRDEDDAAIREDTVPLTEQVSSSDTVSLRAMRLRVAELEASLQIQAQGSKNAGPSLPKLSHERNYDQAEEASSHSPSNHNAEMQDTSTVLEFLAWGRVKDSENSMVSPELIRDLDHDDAPDSDDYGGRGDLDPNSVHNHATWLQMLLPSQRQVHLLVEYHNELLLWFHGSFVARAFSKELEVFYREHHGNIESHELDLQWVALLFAVLAGTMTTAPGHILAKWGFSERERTLLSWKWYKAVLSSLHAADYTTHQSLYSVQAVCTLTGTAHILGQSNSQSVMLACAVKIAQNLGLHKLDESSDGDDAGLEAGRRVWEQLCTQDWFSASFSETYTIHPLHSSSLSPKNCNDEMVTLPETEPTITSFCRFLAKIAAIMPSLQDGMASSNTLYTKHEQVLLYDRKMRKLATEGRPLFFANTPLAESWPCYIPWARRAISMSSAHKIIMIHRKFLTPSFSDPVFAFTRRTCVAASKTIMKEYIANTKDESSPTFWTFQAFAVAACIVICLDILNPPSISIQADLELLGETCLALKSCGKRSMIASRGVKLLDALKSQTATARPNRKRAGYEVQDRDNPKRQRGLNLVRQAPRIGNEHSHPNPILATATGLHLPETSRSVGEVSGPMLMPFELDGFWDFPLNGVDDFQQFEDLLMMANK